MPRLASQIRGGVSDSSLRALGTVGEGGFESYHCYYYYNCNFHYYFPLYFLRQFNVQLRICAV